MANRVGLFYITKKRVPLYRNYFKLYSHNKLKVPGISQGNEMCNMSESMVFWGRARTCTIISCQQWQHHGIEHPNDHKEVRYGLKSFVKKVVAIGGHNCDFIFWSRIQRN